MRFFDVWQNSSVPLLAGIPLLVFILFALCTCIDKTVTLLRRSWISWRCRPRTPRRVRFDCESHSGPGSGQGSLQRLIRSGTSPKLSGLMAHSTFVHRNSPKPGYRYSAIVHSDPHSTPIPTRTILGREHFTVHERERELRASELAQGSSRDSMFSSSSVPVPHSSRRYSNPQSQYSPHCQFSQSARMETSFGSLDRENPMEAARRHRRYSTPNSPHSYANYDECSYASINTLPEVRTFLQFTEGNSDATRPRSYSFGGHNSTHSYSSSSRRSSRRSSRHRPRSRSPSPYALERTAMISNSDEMSAYSSPGSYGRYLTPQGSSDQGSFKSPEPLTPDWMDTLDNPPNFEDCLSNLSQSQSSIKTSFI